MTTHPNNPVNPRSRPASDPRKTRFVLVILAAAALLLAGLTLSGIISPRLIYRNLRAELKRFAYTLQSHDFLDGQVVIATTSRVSPKDGMVMIYIPAGDFLMGSDAKDVQKSRPQRTIYLDAYWIDQTEVTNAMYALCVTEGGCREPLHNQTINPNYTDPRHADDPVVYVKWTDASDYCTWAGRRLPTEAEWEKAARGADGRTYPWGEALPTASRSNFNNNIGGLLPVNRYPAGASPYGVLNMAGNVREWVGDWYKSSYYRRGPLVNPPGPDAGKKRVLRGGSYDDDWRQVRVFNRFPHNPQSRGINRGFRCAAPE